MDGHDKYTEVLPKPEQRIRLANNAQMVACFYK